jgi:hypothetical protein
MQRILSAASVKHRMQKHWFRTLIQADSVDLLLRNGKMATFGERQSISWITPYPEKDLRLLLVGPP